MSTAATTVPVAAAPSTRDADRRETARALLRSPGVLIGGGVLLFWILSAVLGPSLVPDDPFASDSSAVLQAPSSAHLMGTDKLGRDVFSRVIVGARDILVVAPLATLLGLAAGTLLGLLMGYLGGVVDAVLGRIMEAILALPTVVVALISLVALGSSPLTVILVIGFLFTPHVARTTRSGVVTERRLEYVEAARLRGERAPYVMLVEILPNVLPLVLVEATVRLGYAIFTVATLSFVGVGIQPPSPDWGLSIFENYNLINGGYWWPTLFPALAIATLVVSVNLLSDSVSSVLGR
jgi:peptide/nickel transport system permease protein